MLKKSVIAAVLVAAAATQFSLVALGNERNGSTVLVFRWGETNQLRPVLDSADGRCKREEPTIGESALFWCNGAVATGVVNSGKVIARMPFSKAIHSMTTP